MRQELSWWRWLDAIQDAPRYGVWVMAACLGFALMWPWWGDAWHAWQTAQEAQALAQAQQQEADELERQTSQLVAKRQSVSLSPDAQRLAATLVAQGLVVVEVGMDRALTDVRNANLQVAQVPVRVGFEGAWSHWQDWLRALPQHMPGTTLAALDIRPTHAGQLTAQATLSMPRMGEGEDGWQLASAQTSVDELLDQQAWQAAQQQHALHHAAKGLATEQTTRVKDPLEFFNRSQLQYVGVMGWGDQPQALVRVTDVHAPTSLYRVPVGARLGKDAGRVRVIDSDYLLIDEWVQDASGQWRNQEVRMPLKLGAAP